MVYFFTSQRKSKISLIEGKKLLDMSNMRRAFVTARRAGNGIGHSRISAVSQTSRSTGCAAMRNTKSGVRRDIFIRAGTLATIRLLNTNISQARVHTLAIYLGDGEDGT